METVKLRDALYNFSPDSGASEEYCRGLIVGLMSGLMAGGQTWHRAMVYVSVCLPDNARITPQSIPETWISDIQAERRRQRAKVVKSETPA